MKLAEAVFTSETATGWQRAPSRHRSRLSAGTTYVASYFTGSGRYAIDRPYFATSGHSNPPLEALADGQDGPNGVFIDASYPGAFPTSDFQATNYWVDVEFTTTGANVPPIAVNDSYVVAKDATLNTNAPGVLANDNDLELDPLTAVLVAPPTHGTLTLNSNGSFTYTPQAGFAGVDSFTYKASDGQASSNIATVTISVGSNCPCSIWSPTDVPVD